MGLYIGEMCRYLLTSESRPADKKHQVRMFVGSGLHASVWRRFVERFGVSKICEIYGATEGNVNTGLLTAYNVSKLSISLFVKS